MGGCERRKFLNSGDERRKFLTSDNEHRISKNEKKLEILHHPSLLKLSVGSDFPPFLYKCTVSTLYTCTGQGEGKQRIIFPAKILHRVGTDLRFGKDDILVKLIMSSLSNLKSVPQSILTSWGEAGFSCFHVSM